jgi:type IV pilus assembly protein PilV
MPRANRPRAARRRCRSQRGIMLLEALIAILIFSVGILGLVGLQATAVKQSTDARLRAEAAQLADQLLGQMWADNREIPNLQARYNTCASDACPGYEAWVRLVSTTLPGVTVTSPTLRPSVNVNADGIVTISIFWRAPGDEGPGRHRYDVEAQIAQ